MAITLTDFGFMKGLLQMRAGLAALLSTRQTAYESYSTRKARLDEEWQAELYPVMGDLYWSPFRNGLAEAPEDESALRAWLSDHYNQDVVVAALLALLMRYQRRAYNLGGQLALDLLGIDEFFNLTNGGILTDLDAFAAMLVRQSGEINLIGTTIDDLVAALQAAREGDGPALLALAEYIQNRTDVRTVLIERSERPRQVAAALATAFIRNEVGYMMYDVAGVGCPRVCAPYHGRVYRTSAWPARLIPQHPACDCIWSPVLYNGQSVGTPPVVVDLGTDYIWNRPEALWIGQ